MRGGVLGSYGFSCDGYEWRWGLGYGIGKVFLNFLFLGVFRVEE